MTFLLLAAVSVVAPAADPGAGLRSSVERLLAEGRYGESLAMLEEALRSAPSDVALLGLKARCLFEAGDYPSCEALLAKLLAGPPEPRGEERARLLLRLSEARLLQGDGDASAAAASEALATADAPAISAAAGGIFLRAQRYGEALPLLERAVEAQGGDLFLRYARGVARAKTGALQDAVDDLLLARKDPQLAAEAGFELGLAFGKLGDGRRAVESLLAVLAEDPWHSAACYALAQELVRAKKARLAAQIHRYFQALKDAEGVSSRDHHLALLGRPVEAGIERALRWERLGRYEKAIAEYAALKRSSANPAVARAESGFWLRSGLAAEALRSLETAAGGADPGVLELAARTSAALGREAEARSILPRLAGFPGSARTVLLDLAALALDRGDAPASERWLGEAAALGPAGASDRWWYLRGGVLIEEGRWQDLLDELGPLGDESPLPLDLFRARALAALGRTEEARRHLARAEPSSAGRPLFLAARAEILSLEGDPRGAEERKQARDQERRERTHREMRRGVGGLSRGAVPPALLSLATEALSLGLQEEAFRSVRLAVALAPRSPEALRQAADLHRNPEDVLLRIHFLRRLLALRPGEAAARAELSEALEPFGSR